VSKRQQLDICDACACRADEWVCYTVGGWSPVWLTSFSYYSLPRPSMAAFPPHFSFISQHLYPLVLTQCGCISLHRYPLALTDRGFIISLHRYPLSLTQCGFIISLHLYPLALTQCGCNFRRTTSSRGTDQRAFSCLESKWVRKAFPVLCVAHQGSDQRAFSCLESKWVRKAFSCVCHTTVCCLHEETKKESCSGRQAGRGKLSL
jgi:hypothetical protein